MSPPLAMPQVWISSLISDCWNPVELESWLDSQELKRYRAFGHPDPARRFLLGRGILKSVVAKLSGLEPRTVKLAYSDNGKPYLPRPGFPYFSISHCPEAVAVAVASFDIGLDLENIRRPRQPWTRPGIFLHPREAERVRKLPLVQQAQAFAHRWTCQEAAVKLLDASILDEHGRILFDDRIRTGKALGHCVSFSSWHVGAETGSKEPIGRAVNAQAGLILSLAGFSPLPEVELHRWPVSL